jgi:hypothetical protein
MCMYVYGTCIVVATYLMLNDDCHRRRQHYCIRCSGTHFLRNEMTRERPGGKTKIGKNQRRDRQPAGDESW